MCDRDNDFAPVSTILPLHIAALRSVVYLALHCIKQIRNVRRLSIYLLYFIQYTATKSIHFSSIGVFLLSFSYLFYNQIT